MAHPQPQCNNIRRRTFLSDIGMGFTGLALGAMLHEDGVASEGMTGIPDGKPHFPPKAKHLAFRKSIPVSLEKIDPINSLTLFPSP